MWSKRTHKNDIRAITRRTVSTKSDWKVEYVKTRLEKPLPTATHGLEIFHGSRKNK